jgi:hypothetical protein
MRTSLTFGGITLTRTPSGAVHLVTASGQQTWLSPREAADLLGALNALPDVAHAWLHGGAR